MNPAQMQQWFEAVRADNAKAIRSLIKGGVDVNAAPNGGWPALHVAVWCRHTATVQILLRAGADANIAANPEHRTALHWAAARGDTSFVRLLLRAGADPNARDKNGWTALHYAVGGSHDEPVAELLRAGADVNAINANGKTPRDVIGSRQFRDTFDRIVAGVQAKRVHGAARVRSRALRPRL